MRTLEDSMPRRFQFSILPSISVFQTPFSCFRRIEMTRRRKLFGILCYIHYPSTAFIKNMYSNFDFLSPSNNNWFFSSLQPT